jgi:hypothetical protein
MEWQLAVRRPERVAPSRALDINISYSPIILDDVVPKDAQLCG